ILPAAPVVQRPTSLSAAKLTPGEWWMGIYLGANKLGYAHVTTALAGKNPGEGYRVRSSTFTRTAVLGYALEQHVETDEVLDGGLRPVTLHVRIVSAGKEVEVSARYRADEVELERRAGNDVLRKLIPIPAGANLVADMETALRQRQVRPGEPWRYTFLNVVTLELEEATTTAVGEERVEVDGRTHTVSVLRTTSATIDATAWLLPNGEPVKMVMAPGLTMVREPREKALSGVEAGPYDPGRDLAKQTAVQTVGSVPVPGRVKFLRLRVEGIPERRFVLSDFRQRAQITSPEGRVPLTVEYAVNAEAEAPLTALSPAERAALLQPSPYLQVDHPEIQAASRQAVGDAGDDTSRVQALWKWVHQNVRTGGEIGLARSALEVLHDPVGMCRDYATLYAALARAAGIPTRVCAGIVYFQDRFYYHVWAESHAGGRWIPVDPTAPAGFVDATRVKFAEGDVAAVYGAVKIVGRLAAEILESR
ncbi:MAG: transglutaminase domain-containing protein, partial [Armatimonadota bacterium]|nr:transglutaminase domain-containing protein [Armatimonadota bacterium]